MLPVDPDKTLTLYCCSSTKYVLHTLVLFTGENIESEHNTWFHDKVDRWDEMLQPQIVSDKTAFKVLDLLPSSTL